MSNHETSEGRVGSIEFGSPRDPEIRSLALHLDNGTSVVLTATSWKAITIEGS